MNKIRRLILLIDPDPLLLLSLAQDLVTMGYHVKIAASAEAAEALLMIGERPDLVILDPNLPGGMGMELVHRISTRDGIPLLLMATYHDEALADLVATNGVWGYLEKPLDVTQVTAAITTVLARTRDYKDLSATSAQLQAALETEREISIAVGITMVQCHMDRRCALKALRKKARTQQRTLSDLARELIESCE